MSLNNTGKTGDTGGISNTGKTGNVGGIGRKNGIDFALGRNKRPQEAKKDANMVLMALTHWPTIARDTLALVFPRSANIPACH